MIEVCKKQIFKQKNKENTYYAMIFKTIKNSSDSIKLDYL